MDIAALGGVSRLGRTMAHIAPLQIRIGAVVSGETMNTTDLVDHLATSQGMTKAAAKEAIETVLQAIVDAAAKGDEVALAGFGKFKVASREARQGRNPVTGATITIAASKKLAFVPAKAVKDALNPAPKKKSTKAKNK
jgi:DNA-binding protein HU-beta